MPKRVVCIVLALIATIGLIFFATLPPVIKAPEALSNPVVLETLIGKYPLLSQADLEAHCAIESVALEHIPGDGRSPAYTVTYFRSGKAEYVGEEHAERIGHFHGELDERSFARLCQFVERMSFASLEKEYWGNWMHMPSVKVTVVKEGRSYEVLDYDEVGPPELWALEHALDGLASRTSWSIVSVAKAAAN